MFCDLSMSATAVRILKRLDERLLQKFCSDYENPLAVEKNQNVIKNSKMDSALKFC